MARPKAYDLPSVLTSAMHLFRRRGYAASSIKDLERATGLTPGSIYNGFGDKDGLFRAAVAHHNATVLQPLIDAHLAGKPGGLTGLRAFLLAQVADPDGDRAGGLLTNASVELGRLATPELAVVHAGLDQLLKAFKRALSQARKEGTLAGHLKLDDTAQRLLVFYQGLQVTMRSGLAIRSLKKVVDAEIDSLRQD